ncbi:hypothetical protein [Neorhizobium sp. DAR64872/K0K18]|uniref:hypothetical protein n=1 Tax=Neorhizobium sp. DAR64872/K0K18 TaxID=3421958 RepID=UPI003D2B5272
MTNAQSTTNTIPLGKFSDPSMDFATLKARSYLSRVRPTMKSIYVKYKRELAVENELRHEAGLPLLRQTGGARFKKIIKLFPASEVAMARHSFEEVGELLRSPWFGSTAPSNIATDNGPFFHLAALARLKKLREQR